MARTLVAGSAGMVGSAVVRALEAHGHTALRLDRTIADLTNSTEVQIAVENAQADSLVIAAAKVGGIHANNSFPADFLLTNLQIQSNLIESAHKLDIPKLVFLGSSCIYPRNAEQPMKEDALLTGTLELTNEPYAIAKIAGIKLCESYRRQHGRDYRSLMPTNLYGTGDNFHSLDSHVIPALMRRLHQAKLDKAPDVAIWGSGNARREFLHVDDLASAVIAILGLPEKSYWNAVTEQQSHINVGTGVDVTIRELAELLRDVVGFQGQLKFDTSKPDGTPRKLLDIDRIKSLGWQPNIELRPGLEDTYAWYLENLPQARH